MKTFAATLVFTMGLTLFAPCVSAAEAPQVTVTIADAEGDLALVQKTVSVTDTDSDGALTIHDALYLAHEAYYAGGAAAGYASAQTDYGLSLTKLWGTENGGAYGYYVNHSSAMGLGDTVSDGDCINAFVYTDLTAWSDTYCFFDVDSISCQQGDTLTLTLKAASYDASWNPITVPVADAAITVNGAATAYTTDADGKVTVTVDQSGALVISAVSETMTLVPPCCVVTAAAADVTTTTATAAPSVETGDSSPVVALCAAGAALVAVAAITKKRR